MISLDLDPASLDSSARTALLFQFRGKCLELGGRKPEAGDDRYAFALATLSLATDSDDAIAARLARRALFTNALRDRPQTIRAALTDAGGVDDAAAIAR